ncbi:Outer membrane efflux protein [Flaviramulus basaltis]|uniref:Outer membrane efflux protein n=1 Tax=Flaviramulus basaltis TaxID=369401 RepID=A0A1K2IP56_9FLAO|nr:TolC family protein [Flaviramulus basaltis]SFZ94228.1 Outer membrane efflux protein [Flaviramulus basaltis]
MKQLFLFIIVLFISSLALGQDKTTLEYFINKAKENTPILKENNNLLKIGELQNNIITAQNNAFQVNATSDVLVTPFFNNNGKAIDITTSPSANAFGYDVGVTNGGLYSAQINVTKNLFNQSITDNLLFQNKIGNNSITLSSEEITHNLIKNITDAYIMAYQLQLQEEFTKEILKDLEKRLQVIELLVKRVVLMESDYLLLQLDIEGKKLELQQIQNNLKVAINQLYNLSSTQIGNIIELESPNFKDDQNPLQFFYQKKFKNDSLQIVANQRVFENQYKPQVTAYANTGLNAVEIPNIYRKFGASAGLRLTIPIYDGKQRKYNAQQSILKEESLEFYKENSKVQTDNNLKSIENQIQALVTSMELLEKQSKQQENILEIYKGKLVHGQVSIVDYLNVIQNYKLSAYTKLQMQTNHWLLQSQYNFINW